MRRSFVGVLGFGLVIAYCAQGAEPAFEGPGVALTVAPLSLPGITNACYDIIVDNGAGDIVWERGSLSSRYPTDTGAICSDQFGNGAGGDIAYVGPCDATPGTDHVTIYVDQLLGAGDVPLAATEWADPCPTGCQLSFQCVENQDVQVTFNLTILRQAHQGFFDVAITFEDIFCSAKLDCTYDDAGTAPINLLFEPDTGVRGQTAVIGFACTAGPNDNDETILHVADARVVCDPREVFAGLSLVPETCDEQGHVFGLAVGQDNVTGARLVKGVEWDNNTASEPTEFVPSGATTAADGRFLRVLLPDDPLDAYVYALGVSLDLDEGYLATNPLRSIISAFPIVLRRGVGGTAWTVTQELDALPGGVQIAHPDWVDPVSGAFIADNFFGRPELRNTAQAKYVVWLPDSAPYTYLPGAALAWPAEADYCDISGVYDLHATGDCKITGADESRYYVWDLNTGTPHLLPVPSGGPTFDHYPPKLSGTIYALGSDVYLGTSEYYDPDGNLASIITTWRASGGGYVGAAIPGIYLAPVPRARLQLYGDNIAVANVDMQGTSAQQMIVMYRDAPTPHPPGLSTENWRIWGQFAISGSPSHTVSSWLASAAILPGVGVAGTVAEFGAATPVMAHIPAPDVGQPGTQDDTVELRPMPFPLGTNGPAPESVVFQSALPGGTHYAVIGSAKDELLTGPRHKLVWIFNSGGNLTQWNEITSANDTGSTISTDGVFGLQRPFADGRWSAPVAPRCSRLLGESIATNGVSNTDKAITWNLAANGPAVTADPTRGGIPGKLLSEPDLVEPPWLDPITGVYSPIGREIQPTTCDASGRKLGFAAGENAGATVEGRIWQWNSGTGAYDVQVFPTDGVHDATLPFMRLADSGGYEYLVAAVLDVDPTYRGTSSFEGMTSASGAIVRVDASENVAYLDALVAPGGAPNPNVMPTRIDPETETLLGRGLVAGSVKGEDASSLEWLIWPLANPAVPLDYTSTGTLLETAGEVCTLDEIWGGTIAGSCLNGDGEARYFAWDDSAPGTRMSLPLPTSGLVDFAYWLPRPKYDRISVVDADHILATIRYHQTTGDLDASMVGVWTRGTPWTFEILPYGGGNQATLNAYADGYAMVTVLSGGTTQQMVFQRPATFPNPWSTTSSTLTVDGETPSSWFVSGYLAPINVFYGTFSIDGVTHRPFQAYPSAGTLIGGNLPMPATPTNQQIGAPRMQGTVFVSATRHAVIAATEVTPFGTATGSAATSVPYLIAWVFQNQGGGASQLVDWTFDTVRDTTFELRLTNGPMLEGSDDRWAAYTNRCGAVMGSGRYIEPGQQSTNPREESMGYAWMFDGSNGEQVQGDAMSQVHLPDNTLMKPPIFSHTLHVDQGRGNQWTSDPNLQDNLFQFGVYYGNEELNCGSVSCNKRYFNLAFGFSAPLEENCYLYFDGTASNQGEGFSAGWPPPDTVYPRVDFAVQLTALGEMVCRRNPLGGEGSGVQPTYSEPSIYSEPVRYCYSYDGTTVTDHCAGTFDYYYDQPPQ